MKYKSIIPSSLLLGVVLFLSNCSNNPGPGVGPCDQFGKWWNNQPLAEDVIYGVGVAQKKSTQLSRNTAEKRARDQIAKQVGVKVKAMVRDFMDESGLGEGAQATEFSESVGESVANKTLEGSRVLCFNVIAGETWCLVEYDIGAVRAATRAAAESEAHKDEALYNEFKARNGFDNLDKKTESMDGN